MLNLGLCQLDWNQIRLMVGKLQIFFTEQRFLTEQRFFAEQRFLTVHRA